MKIEITEPVIIDGVDYFGGEVVETEENVALRIIASGRAIEAAEKKTAKSKKEE